MARGMLGQPRGPGATAAAPQQPLEPGSPAPMDQRHQGQGVPDAEQREPPAAAPGGTGSAAPGPGAAMAVAAGTEGVTPSGTGACDASGPPSSDGGAAAAPAKAQTSRKRPRQEGDECGPLVTHRPRTRGERERQLQLPSSYDLTGPDADGAGAAGHALTQSPGSKWMHLVAFETIPLPLV